MRGMIQGRVGKMSMAVRETALDLTRDLAQKDWFGEARRIHEFVRDDIRYVKDIRGVETVQTPERTLINKSGDCDDKTALASAMLETLGHPTRLVAIAFKPGKFIHVFPEVWIRGEWIAVETTEPKPLGWKPKKKHHRMVVHNR